MKNLKLYFIFTAIIMFAMVACSKEDVIDNDSLLDQSSLTSNKNSYKDQTSKAIFELAKNLSIAVEKDQFILSDLEKRCDLSNENGHYEKELFYHLDKEVSLGKLTDNNLSKILKSDNNNYKSSENICGVPGLSILLEGNLESSNYSNRIYLDDGFDDSDPNAHIKYYENGVMSSHSISEVPDAKAFVVRVCEAYIPKNDPMFDIQKKATTALIKNIGYTDCGEEINIVQSTLKATDLPEADKANNDAFKTEGDCDRDDNNDNLAENITLFKTTNNHEGWRGRHGEFMFFAIWGSDVEYGLSSDGLYVDGNPLSYAVSGIYPIKENELAQINYRSIVWDLPEYTKKMKYVIYESDGGSTKEVDFSLEVNFEVFGQEMTPTVNIPITINDGDDFVAEQIVNYCDEIGDICCSGVIRGAHTTGDGGTFDLDDFICCLAQGNIGEDYTPGGGVTFFLNNE